MEMINTLEFRLQNKTNNSHHFRTANGMFSLILPDLLFQKMLHSCRAAKTQETGGILVGHYNDSLEVAIVTDLSRAPSDSTAGVTWFYRGVWGLQRWLNRLWKNERYYLGEWHFHPFGMPEPSDTDIVQMERIAQDKRYHCPEPLLFIYAEGSSGKGTLRVFVFPHGESFLELKIQGEYIGVAG